jgi:hypothetical protein
MTRLTIGGIAAGTLAIGLAAGLFAGGALTAAQQDRAMAAPMSGGMAAAMNGSMMSGGMMSGGMMSGGMMGPGMQMMDMAGMHEGNGTQMSPTASPIPGHDAHHQSPGAQQ